MSSDNEPLVYRIPTLVQMCQRVAASHVNSIHSLGDSLRYDLLKPVLDNCSAETLLRLEQTSPYIEHETSEIWKALCFRSYPIPAERYRSDNVEEPESWRDEFFLLREMEAKRFEQLGTRLRTIRQEEAERKKETQIKLTDKLPPSKRARPWGPSQPKTLLQKTRSEAARVQKGIYGMRVIPPMPTARTYSANPIATANSSLPSTSTSSIASLPSSSRRSGSRVTVTRVAVRRPSSMKALKPSISTVEQSSTALPPPATSNFSRDAESSISSSDSHKASPPRKDAQTSPSKPPLPSRKDPASSLFMPKHRAHSQRPAQPLSSRGMYSRA